MNGPQEAAAMIPEDVLAGDEGEGRRQAGGQGAAEGPGAAAVQGLHHYQGDQDGGGQAAGAQDCPQLQVQDQLGTQTLLDGFGGENGEICTKKRIKFHRFQFLQVKLCSFSSCLDRDNPSI